MSVFDLPCVPVLNPSGTIPGHLFDAWGVLAMAITVEAVYENGVLKPAQPLPFREHEKVRITVQPVLSRARQTAGLLALDQSAPALLKRPSSWIRNSTLRRDDDLHGPPSRSIGLPRSNALLYHFTADPKHGDTCSDLVERVKRQELVGL